ncbi:AAA family ATPase [Aphanizomenon flos-aquae NRERC-008]|uniref:AAA family ATPase n=2 Tax=Aphanizomenon flos-aquae TaxID=1176 RepID=A0ABR8IQ63_APHFL|nr:MULTISPECIES: AAA family ATPase [Aphanizomenon]MBD2390324.1 AAA family ATPase [Aphanizomenon flos-aquae FACHB-1171]MBD2555607.1 AAA family ATPase [Aphanizomenon flos-aquae FACHB-1290]MBD2631394.1 AAA family ATPase [Aphanizomenon sp. FACHB-1399]MBD2642490.1 AAA family ATPase [Aphanizomenon sp. FACHB-1401]MBD2655707.1 AAA family ATPase [Aphanizomenon flos-aquae FACHB-1265]
MQKIIINNFGSIKYAEIEVKKILVLIGEQASGKSTIAKLIYFFKTIQEDLFSQIYRDKQNQYLDINSDILSPIQQKFYNFFGPTNNLPDFEITFYYSFNENKFLKLSNDENKKMKISPIDTFINEKFTILASDIKFRLRQEYLNINKNRNIQPLIKEEEKIKYAQQLYDLLNDLFQNKQRDLLFIVAGRSATVAYPSLFEKYFSQSIEINLKQNISIDNYERSSKTLDEILLEKFIEKFVRVKDIFKKFRNFEGLIESYSENNIKEKLYQVKNKIDKILKGEYRIDDLGEKILFNKETEEYIYLSNTSSGQQESIRILQDIFLNILDNTKVLRILEEPEAHLFPIAQKQLIELLALMINQNNDNQLIITTHSPYVLTVFNNLLFANRVVEKNPSTQSEVAQIIPQDSWLSAKDFSAYSLGNQSVSQDTNYCEPIFNQEKGTIQQNYLDTVSEILGGDFQALYSIHAKTFKRK